LRVVSTSQIVSTWWIVSTLQIVPIMEIVSTLQIVSMLWIVSTFAPEGRKENSPGQAQRSPGKAAKINLAPRRGAVKRLFFVKAKNLNSIGLDG
jgi:hypothetical protein